MFVFTFEDNKYIFFQKLLPPLDYAMHYGIAHSMS